MTSLEIPLFPLRTVLFPGMPLPLRIFEERYRVMTRELLESRGVFGVLLIRQGEETGGGAIPFDVGTTALIEEAEEVEGGRFVLACRGERRFRLDRMLPPKPYPFGAVSMIEEASGRADPRVRSAVAGVRRLFPDYFHLALALTDQWARPFELPSDPNALVNLVGPWLKTDEPAKQRLLEIIEPLERVQELGDLLARLIEQARGEVRDRQRQRYAGLGSLN